MQANQDEVNTEGVVVSSHRLAGCDHCASLYLQPLLPDAKCGFPQPTERLLKFLQKKSKTTTW